jgi:hypothetical protein
MMVEEKLTLGIVFAGKNCQPKKDSSFWIFGGGDLPLSLCLSICTVQDIYLQNMFSCSPSGDLWMISMDDIFHRSL